MLYCVCAAMHENGLRTDCPKFMTSQGLYNGVACLALKVFHLRVKCSKHE